MKDERRGRSAGIAYVVGLLGVIVLAGGLAVRRADPAPSDGGGGAARYLDRLPADERTAFSLVDRVERAKRITSSDWRTLASFDRESKAYAIGLTALMFAKEPFPERPEAIRRVQERLIRLRGQSGRIPLVLALRSMDDPEWRAEADRVVADGGTSGEQMRSLLVRIAEKEKREAR